MIISTFGKNLKIYGYLFLLNNNQTKKFILLKTYKFLFFIKKNMTSTHHFRNLPTRFTFLLEKIL